LENALIEKAASHWDSIATAKNEDLMLRWWDSPMLHRLVDENWWDATGCKNAGEFIRRETGRQTLGLGISIGCGSAEDEIILLEQNVLERLIICDISNEQLNKAEEFAASRGIDKNRLIRLNHVDLEVPFSEKLDLIYWRHSLHHMFDTEKTILWCRDNLTDHGAIYCNDACPPNRMQWDETTLKWTELYRASLPHEYLRSPFEAGQYLPYRPNVPSVEFWKSVDPTECADSANIIPAIRKHAPNARVAFLGGCIYALALDDILNNFRKEEDLVLLRNAMGLDKFMSNAGMNYFFTCVINRRDFT
jgi:SAM-dependent methyltransferase